MQNVYRKGPMRPQYDQDEYHQEAEDDDDDKTVIVYNETSIEQPWNFSQISGTSPANVTTTTRTTTTTTTTTAQRGKENCEKEQHRRHDEKEEAAAATSNFMSRKRQHRSLGSRRRGRNLPRRPGFPSDGNGIDIDIDNDNDEVDGFASLRSMMGKLSQEQKRNLSKQLQQADGESGVHLKTQRQGKMCGDKHKANRFLSQNASDNDNNSMIEPPSLLQKITLPPLGIENTMLQNQLVDPDDSTQAPLRNSAPPRNIRTIDSGANATENDTKNDRASANRLCSPPDFDFCAADNYDDEENNDEAEIVGKAIKRNRTTTKSSSIPSRLQVRNQNSLLDHSGKKDDDDDDDDDTTGRMNRCKRHSSSNTKQYTANPKHRSEKSKKRRHLDRHDSNKRFSVSTSSSSAAAATVSTTNNRRRKRPDTISRRGFASSSAPDSEKSKRQHLSQPTQAATNVENVKSIVGLRPTHWHRSARSLSKRSSSSIEPKSSQPLAKASASALAAATRFSFRMPNRTKKPAEFSSKAPVENVGHGTILSVHNTSSSNPPSTIQKNHSAETPSDTTPKPSTSEAATKPSFSFAPSFVPTKSSVLSEDAIGEDDSGDDDCRVIPAPTNNFSFASTPPFKRRRRSKAANGEWVRRLVSLRNTQSNDSVRLQNKAFAHQRRMLLDVSDPRKRAKTYTDVTILGQYGGPWMNVPEDTKITVLGYAHRHMQQYIDESHHRSNTALHQQHQKQEDTKTISNDFFAWFTFTLATARRIELQQGCKLRIYNAIILPCRLPVVLDIPPSSAFFLENNIEIDSTSSGTTTARCCERTVICTHLCERILSFN